MNVTEKLNLQSFDLKFVIWEVQFAYMLTLIWKGENVISTQYCDLVSFHCNMNLQTQQP